MPTRKIQRNNTLNEALVLYSFILSLFGCDSLKELCEGMKAPDLEGRDEEGHTRFCEMLKVKAYNSRCEITRQQIEEYDNHIVHHTKRINRNRRETVRWKYYQYMSLLFTEIYLDRFFTDRDKLRSDLNLFLHDSFNRKRNTWHGMSEFTDKDMNKLAFWCATGSGKTLLMHVNILQFLYYAEKHKARKINRILLITPNEGMSAQHLEELHRSSIPAVLFDKNTSESTPGRRVDVIDIFKLGTEDKDKTVAVDNFEGNNLVLVDEGHKGTSGETQRGYRDKLAATGFSFEYSATFGQAIAAVSGDKREVLLNEYGKATIFDYSYKYFYSDGFGKDYRIMNMTSWDDEQKLNMYLTGYLLSLYEQMLVFKQSPKVRNEFLVAKPLGIFVGGSVNAVKTVRGRKMSDVVQILDFLQQFVDKPEEFSEYIRRLLDEEDGIRKANGVALFANSFILAKKEKERNPSGYADIIYHDLLSQLFHSDHPGSQLHLIQLKGSDGEIGLRIGTADFFGVVNVGDTNSLLKVCTANGLDCETKELGTISLFDHVNESDSGINLVIGSKKFNEGWSSWRVSAMGLMNVGRSEGSEIIQLFGRGVRLKGYRMSLKRSSSPDIKAMAGSQPLGLGEIETLNVFGVRSDYMESFRKYLHEEGVPDGDEKYTTIDIPTVNLLKDKKLKVVRMKEGADFQDSVVVNPEEYIRPGLITLNRIMSVQAEYSEGTGVEEPVISRQSRKLTQQNLDLIDWNQVFFELEQMKDDKEWYNLEIAPEKLRKLMEKDSWYTLYIDSTDLELHDFSQDVSRWQEIVVTLLKMLFEKAYRRSKSKWCSQHLETAYLTADDANFFDHYTVEVSPEKTEWIELLKELSKQITSGSMPAEFLIYSDFIKALRTDQHLYYPLMCLREKDANHKEVLRDDDAGEPLIKISPVALNEGESNFVKSMMQYCDAHKEDTLKDKEVYMLRNESRKGIGFFEANKFYPDFILWVNDGEQQHVSFIDPKGIRNLSGINDAKIQLFKLLRNDIQPLVNKDHIIVDSFIISNTPYLKVSEWMGTESKLTFIENHVLFDEDNDYIDTLFKLMFE